MSKYYINIKQIRNHIDRGVYFATGLATRVGEAVEVLPETSKRVTGTNGGIRRFAGRVTRPVEEHAGRTFGDWRAIALLRAQFGKGRLSEDENDPPVTQGLVLPHRPPLLD